MKSTFFVLSASAALSFSANADTYSCKVKTMEQLDARVMYVKVLKGERPKLKKGGSLIPRENIIEDEVNVDMKDIVKIDSASTYGGRSVNVHDEGFDYYEVVYKMEVTKQNEFQLEYNCKGRVCKTRVLNMEGKERENVLSYQSPYRPSYKSVRVSMFPYIEDEQLKVLMEVNTEILKPGADPFAKFSMRNTAVAKFSIAEIPNTISIEALNHVTRPVNALAYPNSRGEVVLAEVECKK